ncbi:hypothetical protein BH11ARM2_BH11ARM2_10310 [soil metagenome]
MDKPWALPTLIGMALLMAAGATASVPMVAGALALAAGGAFVWAVLKGRKDPYDLKSLRELHEKRGYDEVDVPGVEESGGDVICGRCQNHYSGRLPGCPHCGAGR